jgi:hypothetical protein
MFASLVEGIGNIPFSGVTLVALGSPIVEYWLCNVDVPKLGTFGVCPFKLVLLACPDINLSSNPIIVVLL